VFQFLALGITQIARVERLTEMIEQFHFRGLCDPDEPCKVCVSEAAETLCDISCR